MYVAVYVAAVGPLGLYCMRQTPVWYFDTRAMYEAFPHTAHPAALKFYYLFQAAFWAHQALVMLLGIESRRRDFRELVLHHVVTIALIALSYRFHFTYIGFAVYITHDISDFFLAISKSLNYVGSRLQGPSFALCIVMWTYLRHYLNLRILYSVLTEFGTVGPYEFDWEKEQFKSPLSQAVTFSLLAALQALNLFWLYCLLRSAYRFIVLGVAKDDRSEDEAEVGDAPPLDPAVENKGRSP
ncbi:TRAM/LAG1/CLN8 homology domain-containing protein [Durotheca rogersii]|uniref:TRAM/LAG1/CLN8 homology domain-containing protein n=1 Tax=Durotheca rogersii TaxID=419775 RepID=UPI00221EC09C|nr:TRAM/LAG1/CLN8 homology domain-containing protein [Durotheca rogersii]KAI5866543.1 TRAM/LAG1/CLN8 homology domain-containing protein [Durotheca rogersii]